MAIDSATGRKLFNYISLKEPASVTLQAMRLAEKYKSQPIQILRLRDALLADPNEVDVVVSTANTAHQRRGIPVVIDRFEARRIIQADFDLASRITQLPPGTLAQLKSSLDAIKANYGRHNMGLREGTMRETTELVLATSGIAMSVTP